MRKIIIKRIYEKASDEDGYRILVDRLWPRGIAKEEAQLDEWDKELAPSTELRQWFDHQEDKFPDFVQRYHEELISKIEDLKRLALLSEKRQICLLYGAKNEKMNQTVVLKSILEEIV